MLSPAKNNSAANQRDFHCQAAKSLFDQAKLVAEDGQFSKAGLLILRALDQERRAQISGPQVLQLIKPRT